jgi:hypothetical protein
LEVDSTLRTEEIARMLNARTNRIVALDCQWKVCRKLFYAMQKQQYRVCIQCSNNALQEHDATIARPVKTHLVSSNYISKHTKKARKTSSSFIQTSRILSLVSTFSLRRKCLFRLS